MSETILTKEMQEIADLIGLNATKKLINVFGGCNIYIAKSENTKKNLRNEKIKEKSKHLTIKKLSKIFGLSTTQIRNIVKS